MSVFSKELKRLGGVSVVGLEQTLRYVRRSRYSVRSLERVHKESSLAQALCARHQVDLLIQPEMKLGSKTKPAKILTRLIGCKGGHVLMQTVSFSGRLSRKLWRSVAYKSEAKFSVLLRRDQELFQAAQAAPSRPSTFNVQAPQLGPTQSAEPTPAMTPSEGEVGRRVKQLKPMVAPDARDPWSARLTLWAEGRAMNRTFDLVTSVDSVSLKGGISYTSRWIMGYGLAGRFVLNKLLSFEGEFAEYQFKSTQVIYNLFDDNDFLNLKSLQRVANVGAVISQTFSSGVKQHRAGVRLGWTLNQHLIEPNNEYQGFTAHGIDVQAIGLLSLSARGSWLELRGKITPLLTLGGTVEEIGERTESLGFGFALSLIHRLRSGLSFKLGMNFDELVHTPNGEGRGGRVGQSATDQLFQTTLAVGWSGPD